MNKKKVGLLAGAIVLIVGFAFFRSNIKNNEIREIDLEKENSTYKEVEYTYNDGINKPVDVKIETAPKRIVSLSQFMTETLLSMDLQDEMVGTALLDNEILPVYKEEYEKIPKLKITQGHNISKENFLGLKPDFASGWYQSLTAKGTGTPQELENAGIHPYVASALEGNATIENVYSDYRELGKIFNKEEKAETIITKMKSEIKDVEKKISNINDKDKPKVLIYDSGNKDAYVVGGGFANNLITLSGGKNIFSDLKNQWNNVSFESIASRNPDVILVTDYLAQAQSIEKKLDFIKTNPAFKNINAVKNNKIYKIDLADLSPGIRASKAISEMNTMFYEVG
ncbi:MAG: ABC transporter substrate-binding protein [Sarcina sp.]